MARLQILQLPEGASDDRPPWLLIVDELPTGDAQLDMLRRDLADNDLTARIGARGALCFESTINLPANEPPPLTDTSDPERTGVTQIVYAHERTRLDLCSALRLDTGTPWRKLIEHVDARQRELAGILREHDAPDPKLVVLVRETLGIDNVGPAGIPYDEALHNACRQLEKSEAARRHLNRERDTLKRRVEHDSKLIREIRAESLRRGKVKGEYAECIRQQETDLTRARHRIAVADGQISRVRDAITERRTEVAEFEAENKPSGWSDAVTVTCDRIADALRVFPPSVPVQEPAPETETP